MTPSRPAGATSLDDAGIASLGPRAEFVLAAGLLFALGFSRMFRRWLFDDFDGILGDQGDARILIALLEHWYRSFSGNWSDWLNPPLFYPVRGALGFTDAYLLYAVGYTPLRLAGVDQYTAFMLVMATLSAIGFFGFMRLAIAEFRVSAASAAVGALLFAFAHMMAFKMGHAQSYCAMLLPLVAHLTATAFKARHTSRAIIAAAAAGLLHALIFSTAYFTGWFATLFVLVALLMFAALRGVRAFKDDLHYVVTAKRHVLAAWFVGFAIGIVPFLIIYGPVWLQGHRRDFSDVVYFSPAFSDIINVGRGHWAWGWALRRLGVDGGADRPRGELELGFTPGVAMVCVLMMIVTLRSWLRTPPNRTDARTVVTIALGLSLIACWLAQLSYFGLRPWYAIWALVPGAAAVRTTFRFQIVLNLTAALLVAMALDRIRFRWTTRGPLVVTAAAGVVAALLIAEQFSRAPVTFSRKEQLTWLGSVPQPPADCRAFYIMPKAGAIGAPWWLIQSDAMLIAVHFGIPTLNGNASVYPAGWQLKDPSAPDYLQALRDWSARNGLNAGLCGLQSRTGPWIDGPP
jgi:hypothetical protein